MNAKQIEIIAFLNKAFHLEKNITALVAVHEANISLAERCTASYSSIGGKSISNNNTQENSILKILELEEKINKQIDELIKVRDDIFNLINTVDNDEFKAILTRRYLLYQSTQKIADEMHYNTRTIQRKLRDAIKKLSLNVAE